MPDVGQLFLNGKDRINIGFALNDFLEFVVQIDLVVQIIHFTKADVVAILFGIVYLGQQKRFWIFGLDRRVHITPEFNRNHFGHVIAKSIDAFVNPVKRDVSELLPRIRNVLALPKGEMGLVIALVVISGKCRKILGSVGPDAVVHLDGLIPVVLVRLYRARSVSCPLGGNLLELAVNEFVLFTTQRFVISKRRKLESLAGNVVKVVVAFVFNRCVVVGAKILYARRIGHALVTAGNVIGNDVNDHL